MKNALKKELREKAKGHTITMGILSVKNKKTGKQYIQGSLNLEALVNKMKFLLNGNLFTNAQLQKDWSRQGSECFTFEFVFVIAPQENIYSNYRQELKKAENTFISETASEFY